MQVIVDNLAVEYDDHGQGPTVVLIHGWQDTRRTFDRLVASLTGPVRVVRLDLPGFGQSEMPKEPWTLTNYVDFVAHFLHKLAIQPSVLVGHSFGGRIVIAGLASHKLTTRRCILVAAAGVTERRPLRNALYRVVAKVGKVGASLPVVSRWRQPLRRALYRRADSDYASAGPLTATYLNIVSEDLSSAAAKLTVPTVLFWGADDTVTPLRDGQRLQQLIVNAQLDVVVHGTHAVHQEAPDRLAAHVQAFLEP